MKLIAVFLRAILMVIILSVILGIIYPLVITFISRHFFPYQAEGSLVVKDGVVIGSSLIGQTFTSDRYFRSRPNVSDSSNTPLSKEMLERINQSVIQARELNKNLSGVVPPDLVTDSGSTLDPDISVEAAMFQLKRISTATGLSRDKLVDLIKEKTKYRFLGIYGGEPRVNVLDLNLGIDKLLESNKSAS